MTAGTTPEDIRRATFRVVFRGYDQADVESYLETLASAVDGLEAERQRLVARLGEFAERDLQSEFESVGREVTSVLEAARQAAQTMRDRAAADAARWRAEAVAEAEQRGSEARSDAEALRTDAWTTGTQLLDQVHAEVVRMRDAAESEVLSIRGEAEREAHRMTSAARREAEEVLRNGRMEAERLVGDARSEHDEIIATAHRQAEAAQERTRALEERRQELMAELESVRATLSGFEGELESRRQGSQAPAEPGPTRVAVDESGEPRVESWEDGRTVRIIRPGREDAPESEREAGPPSADELAEEVARLRGRPLDAAQGEVPTAETEPIGPTPPDDTTDPAPSEEPSDPPAVRVSPRGEPDDAVGPRGDDPIDDEGAETDAGVDWTASEGTSSPEPGGPADEVSELFRKLRSPEDAEGPPEGPAEEADADAEAGHSGEPEDAAPAGVAAASEGQATTVNGSGSDPFELRERLLLPVTNAALRSVKRTLMDAQNEALDQIRVTDGSWSPDPSAFEQALLADLAQMVDEALGAGYEAATALGLGDHEPSEVAEPPDVAALPDALSDSLRSALSSAGGPKERSAAATRVFRGWRTDEAERRIRYLALAAYHTGLKDSLDQDGHEWAWEPHGRLCPECRDVSAGHERIPPVHRDCDCTIVPV